MEREWDRGRMHGISRNKSNPSVYRFIGVMVLSIFFADELLASFIEAYNHKLEVSMGKLDKKKFFIYLAPIK